MFSTPQGYIFTQFVSVIISPDIRKYELR